MPQGTGAGKCLIASCNEEEIVIATLDLALLETRIPAINQIIEDRRPETYSHMCNAKSITIGIKKPGKGASAAKQF